MDGKLQALAALALMLPTICCREKCGDSLRRSAREREEKRARIQRCWLTDLSSRVRDGRGTGRFSSSNFVVLAAN
jgi:hypothetical protein